MANAQRAAAVVVAMLLGSAMSGCGSSRESGAVGTSGSDASAITVKISSTSVTVENRTTEPLHEVRVNINPVGNEPAYTFVVSHLAAGESQEVPLGNFHGDGKAFNRMFVKPRSVTVTALGMDEKKYETSASWR